MRKRLGILILCLTVLIVVASACGQPAPEVSTATPAPPTELPAATEPLPTEEPTATQAEPTATPVPPTEAPTATSEPTATTAPPTEEPEPTEAPVEEAQVLLEERCTVCHTLDRVQSSQKSREEWESTVTRMVEYGAQLTDEERAVLLDYLAATYGN